MCLGDGDVAWAQRIPETKLVFHRDQGAQYTSHRFRQLLHEHATAQSFSNSERPQDNTIAETFFASLHSAASHIEKPHALSGGGGIHEQQMRRATY